MVTLVILGGLSSLFILFMGPSSPSPRPPLALRAHLERTLHRHDRLDARLHRAPGRHRRQHRPHVPQRLRPGAAHDRLGPALCGHGHLEVRRLALSRSLLLARPRADVLAAFCRPQRLWRRPRDLRQPAPRLCARVARRDGPLGRRRVHLGLAHLDGAPLGPQGAVPRRRGDPVRACVPDPRPLPLVPMGDRPGRGHGPVCGRVHGRRRDPGALAHLHVRLKGEQS